MTTEKKDKEIKYIEFQQSGVNFKVAEDNLFLLGLLEAGFNLIIYAESFGIDMDLMTLNHPANFISEEELEADDGEIKKVNILAQELQEEIPNLRNAGGIDRLYRSLFSEENEHE